MLKLLTVLVAIMATWNVAHAGTLPTTSQSLSGTTGVVMVQPGSNTVYTNVPQNNAVTIDVPANASVTLNNSASTADTQTGVHNLQTINVQGNCGDYSMISSFGKITLANRITGQVISFPLATPSGAGNTSGVTVNFSNGSIAFTSSVAATGRPVISLTEGGSDTSTWGNKGALRLPWTNPFATSFGTLPIPVNRAVTSQGVNWAGTTSSTSGDADAGADAASGAASAAAAAAGAAADTGSVNVPTPPPSAF